MQSRQGGGPGERVISTPNPARRRPDGGDVPLPPSQQPQRGMGRGRGGETPGDAGSPILTPLHELQLLEEYKAGGEHSQDALAELIRGYQRRVYSICFRMVNHRDDAAELTQDVLIKIIEGLSSYNGQSKLSTWVIRVAMNCCLSHLRKRKLRSHESLHQGFDAGRERGGQDKGRLAGGGQGSAGEHLPPQNVQLSQLRALVVEGLNRLDADSRAILVLRDVQELDYQQLADVLEVPIGTVKSRLFRARAALREVIEQLDNPDRHR